MKGGLLRAGYIALAEYKAMDVEEAERSWIARADRRRWAMTF